MMTPPKLSTNILSKYAKLYEKKWPADIKLEDEFFQWFKKHRYLNKEMFVKIGRWKTKRQTKNYLKNSEDFVKKATRRALAAKGDLARIEALMQLHGVSWAVASVILHFAFPNQYPILDFRALWSLKLQQPKSYSAKFWQEYVAAFRNLLHETRLSARVVDRGLWMYSKLQQKTK